MYLRCNVPSVQVSLQTELQAVAVKLKYPFNVTIVNIYLPDFTWTREDMEDLMRQIPTPFVIVGDFNSHNPLWGSQRLDTRGRIIEDVLEQFDLVILNSGEGTYLNSRGLNFSSADLTICSPNLAPTLIWRVLHDHLYSDHLPISIEILHRPNKVNLNTQERWNLQRADWTYYRKSFPHTELKISVDKSVEAVTNAILKAADKSVPYCKRGTMKRRVPWCNDEVKSAILKKKQALNTFRRSPTIENMINCKRCRVKARQIILMSKNNSWGLYISSITQNTPTKEVWRKIRCIEGKSVLYNQPILMDNDVSTSEPDEVAETLVRIFELNSSTENYNLDILEPEIALDFLTNSTEPYNAPFTIEEFESALRSSKNSAPGIDTIPYEFIRQLDAEKHIILKLFNKIWVDGTYPSQWREAIIIPLVKANKDPTLASNYRPISLTCCLSKILEKMVNCRLMWYLETQKLLSDHQMGFRKYSSCIDNLVHMEDFLQNSFAAREHAVAVFFALEKAYDRTRRYCIFEQLYDWGIRGNLPMSIKSFLYDRRFRVRIGNTLSDIHSQENGIPHGSALSVTLFAIAVNGLLTEIDESVGRCMYVDDLAIFYSSKSMQNIEDTLQQNIDQLVEAAERKVYRFSPSKTKCVHFCRLRKPHEDPIVPINGKRIDCQTTVKFLNYHGFPT